MTARLYAILRSAGCWFLLGILTVVCAIPYLVVAVFAPNGRIVHGIERFWVWFVLWGSRVRLTASGLEHIEPGQSYVVMANHRSLYDIPVLHYLLARNRDLRFIGKKELVKVPFFGWIFVVSRHIVIDRRNRERAIEALRKAVAESEEGTSFMIMPEGTRNSKPGLLPFKKGGFHLAIDTGLPILPVVIRGSDALMRKESWLILPGTIDAEVLPAIPVAEVGKDDLEALMSRTRAALEDALSRGPGPRTKRILG
jgi:1-acyl-sn-glycerol-3-phosphate acyltransferase